MSIAINDTRSKNKTVAWKELQQGCVYIDFEGDYLIFTEDDTLVSLVTAEVVRQDDYITDEFTPVKARLEIY